MPGRPDVSTDGTDIAKLLIPESSSVGVLRGRVVLVKGDLHSRKEASLGCFVENREEYTVLTARSESVEMWVRSPTPHIRSFDLDRNSCVYCNPQSVVCFSTSVRYVHQQGTNYVKLSAEGSGFVVLYANHAIREYESGSGVGARVVLDVDPDSLTAFGSGFTVQQTPVSCIAYDMSSVPGITLRLSGSGTVWLG